MSYFDIDIIKIGVHFPGAEFVKVSTLLHVDVIVCFLWSRKIMIFRYLPEVQEVYKIVDPLVIALFVYNASPCVAQKHNGTANNSIDLDEPLLNERKRYLMF